MHPISQPKATANLPVILVIEPAIPAPCYVGRCARQGQQGVEAADLQSAARLIADHETSSWIIAIDPDTFGPGGLHALEALNSNENHVDFVLLSKRRGDALETLHTQAQQEGITLLAVLRKPVSGEEIETLLRGIHQEAMSGSNGRIPLLSKDELGECLRVGRLKRASNQ
jgi:hypothetical protein